MIARCGIMAYGQSVRNFHAMPNDTHSFTLNGQIDAIKRKA